MKIGAKISLVLVMMTTLAVASVGGASYWLARKSLRESVLAGLQNTAQLKARHIEGLFDGLREDARIAQDYYNIRTNLPIVARYTGDREDRRYVVAKETLDEQLGAWLEVRAEITNLILVSPQGKIIYSAADKYEGALLDQPLPDPDGRGFEEGSRGVYVTDVFESPTREASYELLITAPVRDAHGRLVGVLAFEIDMAPVWALVLDRSGLGDTGETSVAVNKGDHALFLNPLRHDPEAALQRRVVFGTQAAVPIQEAVQGVTGSGITVDYRGEQVVAAWYPLSSLGWGMVAKIDRAEAFAPIRTGAWLTVLATLGGLFLASLLSLLVSRPLSRTLDSLLTVAHKAREGEITVDAEVRSRDELGALAIVFNGMLQSFREVMEQAKTIASGDYSTKIVPRSDKDELGLALKTMTETLESTAEAAEAIAAGRRDVVIEIKGEQDLLAKSLSRMVVALDEAAGQSSLHLWMAQSQAELTDAVSGNQSLEELATGAVRLLCRQLDAQVGAMYVNHEGELRLAGAIGHTDLPKTWQHGEGLVGRVASEKEPLLLSDVPNNYLRIASGVGEATAGHVLLIPALHEGEARGVLELGSLHAFSEPQLEFLSLIGPTLGLSISEALARDRIEELLSESRTQTEALQAQQEELRQTNEELEEQAQLLEEQREKVEVRNREIMRARRQLEDKAGLLAQASKYKSEFLANMSHELRTPLNSLLILARLLDANSEGTLTDKQKEYAQTIHAAGVELLELINEILDLAKIEAGKMGVELVDCPLRELEGYLQRSFGPVAKQRGVEFEVSVDTKGAPSLRTDVKRLQQVLKNLLSNAFKFTSEGRVTVAMGPAAEGVRFGSSSLQLAEHVLAFSVSDTGIGISEDKQALIFEAFQQVDTGVGRKYGGTGLGLSISREIASLLGGELGVESRSGEGTTFTLYLPTHFEPDPVVTRELRPTQVRPTSEGRAATQTSASPTRLGAGADSGAEQVAGLLDLPASVIADDRDSIEAKDRVLLMIEDDPRFAQLLLDTAHARGFKVVVAGDGASGLILARRMHPDAITLDLHLPDASGWTIVDQLGRDPATAHVPVHVLSVEDPVAHSSARGAVAHMQKPSTPEGLAQTFETIEGFLARGPKHLLVVEDDEMGRKSMVALLADTDVVVRAVGTGAEALSALAERSYGCVVLDLGLPDMDGFTLVDAIRKDGRWPGLPVIVHTGRELSHEEELRLQGSADAIIIKNVRSPERLLAETSLFLQKIETEVGAGRQRPTDPGRDEDEGLAGKKVLVVDDDMRNIFALTSLLELHGVEVTYAESGEAALEQLAQPGAAPNAVLMDIMMPGMDGYETTRAVRKLRAHAKTPIIAVTAKAMKGDRQKCLDAGASDYITKPVDPNQLLSLLRVWLYESTH